MRRPRLMMLVALLTILGNLPAWSGDAQTPSDLQIPPGMRACRADAYLVDQDIDGVAVRKEPTTTSAAITMLPAMRMKKPNGGLELYGAELNVVGTNGHGWFMIEGAEYEPADDANGPPRKVQTFGKTGSVYKGRGWVHGSRLGTDIVASRGLRLESGRSARIVHPFPHPNGPDFDIPATFLDCDGAAVRLRATEKGKTIEGWINPAIKSEKLCSNQRTTCS